MDPIIITPLGTVSPYCKKEQNCPAILINYKGKKILLDCGNGSTRLLNLPEDLKDLSVFISHLHKDHYGDLSSVQYASYVYHNLGMLNEEVKIYLPHLDSDDETSVIKTATAFANYRPINRETVYTIDDITISFHDNNSHTIPCYAMKLANDKFKIVYTSDIGNTNIAALVDFCHNANLLICESSFVRSHNSSINTHLSAYEAGTIAKLANVDKLMLTHFWPETPKSEYLKEAREVFSNTVVAEEGKQLVLSAKKVIELP